MIITGTFEVQVTPLDGYAEGTEGIQLKRMSIDKTFHGELSATSRGEMISAQSPVEGFGGYVAIEQVSGSVKGKKGSFVLQHYGLMSAGAAQTLIVEVVPQSGTGELKGLTGRLAIHFEKTHHYEFNYAFTDE